MSQATLLAAIKARLEAIDGIENVHDYGRWFLQQSTFESLFVADNKIQGWTISRTAAPSEQIARGQARRVHRFTIRGFYGLDDSAATEKVFQGLVDAVMDDLDANCGLGGITTGAAPCQLQALDHRMLHRYLCHFAEIIIDAPEHVTYTKG